MAAHPYILARTMKEAHSFARDVLGLQHGRYRVVTSAGTIKSVRNAELYLVPGHDKRYDRFSMKGAIRWTRMTVIDWAEAPTETGEPVTDGLEPAGTQPSITEGADPALVAQFEAFLETGNGDTMVSEGGPAAPEPEQAEEPAEPTVRRRRRCKECGVLVEPDDVEQHAADHLPEA